MPGSGSYYRLGQVSANEDNAYKRLLEALVKDCTECQTSCTKKDCGKPYECNNKTERALTKFEKKLDPKELERRSKIQAKSLEGQQRRAAKKAGTYSRTPKNRTETTTLSPLAYKSKRPKSKSRRRPKSKSRRRPKSKSRTRKPKSIKRKPKSRRRKPKSKSRRRK
jgi:hypothetical protein